MTTFIYALTDPDTGEVRYVGKSNNPEQRYQDHLLALPSSRNPEKIAWISDLKDSGKTPGLIILEEVPYTRWEKEERKWISHFRSSGARLLNRTEGGESSFEDSVKDNFNRLAYYVKVGYHKEDISVEWDGSLQRWRARVCIREEWEDVGLFHDLGDARGACWDIKLSLRPDKVKKSFPPIVSKVCRKCGIEKPASEFYTNSRARDGKNSNCRECVRKR